MTVNLNYTLRTLGLSSIIHKGGHGRKVVRRTNGSDIFIGAGVTSVGETPPDIDLAADNEILLGIVLGLTHWEERPTLGWMYNDEDAPIGDNKWVWVYIPDVGDELWVVAKVNTTIAQGADLSCEDGYFNNWSDDPHGAVAALVSGPVAFDVTAASNTTQYMIIRWV